MPAAYSAPRPNAHEQPRADREIPWGHVSAAVTRGLGSAAEGVLLGAGTAGTALGMTTGVGAALLVGPFVVGVSETAGRLLETTMHFATALEYAAGSRAVESEASAQARAESVSSPVALVARSFGGSEEVANFAKDAASVGIGLLSGKPDARLAGIALSAGPEAASSIADSTSALLKTFDGGPSKSDTGASDSGPSGERDLGRGDSGQPRTSSLPYQPPPKPDSEELQKRSPL